jgi:hypothetical protein
MLGRCDMVGSTVCFLFRFYFMMFVSMTSLDLFVNRTLPNTKELLGARVVDDWLLIIMATDCYCKHVTELNGEWKKLPSLPFVPSYGQNVYVS